MGSVGNPGSLPLHRLRSLPGGLRAAPNARVRRGALHQPAMLPNLQQPRFRFRPKPRPRNRPDARILQKWVPVLPASPRPAGQPFRVFAWRPVKTRTGGTAAENEKGQRVYGARAQAALAAQNKGQKSGGATAKPAKNHKPSSLPSDLSSIIRASGMSGSGSGTPNPDNPHRQAYYRQLEQVYVPAATIKKIRDHVATAIAANPFQRPTTADLHKAAGAGVTREQTLAAVHHLAQQGVVRLGPYTQAPATIPQEHIPYVMPGRAELSYYVGSPGMRGGIPEYSPPVGGIGRPSRSEPTSKKAKAPTAKPAKAPVARKAAPSKTAKAQAKKQLATRKPAKQQSAKPTGKPAAAKPPPAPAKPSGAHPIGPPQKNPRAAAIKAKAIRRADPNFQASLRKISQAATRSPATVTDISSAQPRPHSETAMPTILSSACNRTRKFDDAPTFAPDAPNTELHGIECFNSGIHNGEMYTNDDLRDIAANYYALRNAGILNPPLAIGHEEGDFEGTAAPAYGLVSDARTEDRDCDVCEGTGTVNGQACPACQGTLNRTFLVCDFSDVPVPVADAIKARRFVAVSCEIYSDFVEQGRHWGKVLRRVCALGQELPACRSLAPLAVFSDAGRHQSYRRVSIPVAKFSETQYRIPTYRSFAEEKAELRAIHERRAAAQAAMVERARVARGELPAHLRAIQARARHSRDVRLFAEMNQLPLESWKHNGKVYTPAILLMQLRRTAKGVRKFSESATSEEVVASVPVPSRDGSIRERYVLLPRKLAA